MQTFSTFEMRNFLRSVVTRRKLLLKSRKSKIKDPGKAMTYCMQIEHDLRESRMIYGDQVVLAKYYLLRKEMIEFLIPKNSSKLTKDEIKLQQIVRYAEEINSRLQPA